MSEVLEKGEVEITKKYPRRVAIPYFCKNELEKLSRSYDEAKTVLKAYWEDHMLSLNLRGAEILYVDPDFVVKDRSKGVVAMACEVDRMGYRVKIFTNSKEIEELANLQGRGFVVVRQ